MNPICGKCGKVMTPENSRIHPEYFLHDSCLPEEFVDKNLRANVRNFLFLATLDELKRELKISLERGDKLRARYVQELIDEESSRMTQDRSEQSDGR